MKSLIVLIAALLVGVTLMLAVMEDTGYVLITLGDKSIEMTVRVLVVLVAVLFFLLYVGIRALVRMWTAPRQMKGWNKTRLNTKAHKLQTQGMMGLIEGNWDTAERKLLRHLGHSDTPALNYLGAAQAAQGRGDVERRDYYLAKAHQADPKSAIAIGLTQATLQYRSGQREQALATLKRLRSQAPRNQKVLGLSVKIMQELEDWGGLMEVLPAARKAGAIPAEQGNELERQASSKLLTHTADESTVVKTWQALPRDTRKDPQLVAAYAERLIDGNKMEQAEELLRKHIRREWSPELVRLYGRVRTESPAQQLKIAEDWAKDHQGSPELMLTLAQLSLYNELWGKARAYLEACISAGGSVEAYRELGHLLEQLDEHDAALGYYREGLDQAVPRTVQPTALPSTQTSSAASTTNPPAGDEDKTSVPG